VGNEVPPTLVRRQHALTAVLLAALAGCGGGAKADRAASATATAAPVPAAVATPPAKTTPAGGGAPAKATPPAQAAPAQGAPRPRIVSRPIPFPAKRKREMAAYARRHYGISSYRLVSPHVIVEHYTVTSSFSATYNTFAPDQPDVELHELPGVCSHFVIDRDGTIYQLVPLSIMCRHTVGLNYTAIGIEHVGSSDAEVLGNRRQLASSLALTRWLRCSYGIKLRDVIGHNESLSSPYHHENVARLRSQTHGDWKHADMQVYRSKLGRLSCG
jgi:N-acetylmuramoyl-L-alanine amidase